MFRELNLSIKEALLTHEVAIATSSFEKEQAEMKLVIFQMTRANQRGIVEILMDLWSSL